METIIETDFAHVIFIEEEYTVEIDWKKVKVMPIEEYQKALTVALDFQIENMSKVKFYISDIRKQGVLSPNYRKWFQDVALPRAIEGKLQAGAVIFEGNVFKKYYLNNIMNSTKKFGMPFKFFSEREEAAKWLASL